LACTLAVEEIGKDFLIGGRGAGFWEAVFRRVEDGLVLAYTSRISKGATGGGDGLDHNIGSTLREIRSGLRGDERDNSCDGEQRELHRDIMTIGVCS